MNGNKAARFVLKSYKKLLSLDVSQCSKIGKSIPIPTFETSLLLDLCATAKRQFETMDVLLELRAPFYIVGDIHGNIFDLIRILVSAPPPRARFLFLGDYVDRGEYSIECVTLLFSMMIIYPEHVYLLRGNHEFETMNASYGFAAEVTQHYQSKALYDAFNDTFAYMPLVATFNNQIICVHGGISPHVKDLAQLKKIKRPLQSYEVEIVSDLVWSDPCYDSRSFDESRRGLGVQFGVKALQEFLDVTHMKMLIRAHQCVQSGISRFGGDLLYTVFSCSNYADSQGNRCGLLFLSMQLQLQMFSLPPIDQIPRGEVLVERCTITEEETKMIADDSMALNLSLQSLASKRKINGSKVSLLQGSRENILQRFSNSGLKMPLNPLAATADVSCPVHASLPPLERSASVDCRARRLTVRPLTMMPIIE